MLPIPSGERVREGGSIDAILQLDWLQGSSPTMMCYVARTPIPNPHHWTSDCLFVPFTGVSHGSLFLSQFSMVGFGIVCG